MVKRKAKKPSPKVATTVIKEIVFPKPEDWNRISRDLKLDATQLNELRIAIHHVVGDISFYRSKKLQEPDRAIATTRLKRMERALGKLQGEIDRSIHLMDYFLPNDMMTHIGLSFTFSAIADAVGEKLRPRDTAPVAIRVPANGNLIDMVALDEATRSRREVLGLKHGHLILKHFVDAIHAPLKKWVELDKLNKGGRRPALARTYLIHYLARQAPGIIGKPATVSTTGPFVRLCALVLPACGLSARGIEKAIPPRVRKVRAERNRWHA